MATTIDKNFVVTTPEISGYRIVKYLGVVSGFSKDYYDKKMFQKVITDATEEIIKMGQNVEANAIIGVQYQLFPDTNADYMFVKTMCYGTAVVVEKITE